jgi:hypothetical protein
VNFKDEEEDRKNIGISKKILDAKDTKNETK